MRSSCRLTALIVFVAMVVSASPAAATSGPYWHDDGIVLNN